MRTRWDELAAPFDRLASALAVGDRELLAQVVARGGWGARSVDQPLLPSGIRHGVPWGLSVAMPEGAPAELRVFLEAQRDPPSEAGYLAAAGALLDGLADDAWLRALRPQRLWHAIGFARDRAPAFHAYACVPDRPEVAWAALGRAGYAGEALRAQLGPRARATILSADLKSGGRTKLYAIAPDARVEELPYLDRAPGAAAFARAMLGDPTRRIGWLACYGFTPGDAEPTSLALHFAAAVHGDAGFPDRLAAYAPPAYAVLGPAPRVHFVSYQRARVTVYLLPEVAR